MRAHPVAIAVATAPAAVRSNSRSGCQSVAFARSAPPAYGGLPIRLPSSASIYAREAKALKLAPRRSPARRGARTRAHLSGAGRPLSTIPIRAAVWPFSPSGEPAGKTTSFVDFLDHASVLFPNFVEGPKLSKHAGVCVAKFFWRPECSIKNAQ
jgi:hypothetical protein